ncbi:MAG TPA: NfeD family protein [Opitutaceae bacterium]|nr:NfeD family protein [Opitutaceae bacterium]
MSGRFLQVWLAGALATLVASAAEAPSVPPAPPPAGSSAPATPAAPAKAEPGGKVTVYVVPVRDEIAQPALYILRRGLKEAIERNAGAVVLDMQTPGGRADVAFDMMEALEKFPGVTATYVDSEAMSAGAFIAAATKEIWFVPKGVIGAAAAVTAEGQDIPETMRLKINSFLRAKMRAISEDQGYRGQVISAMIDKDYELKIGDAVIKPKGELLSLTANEAAKAYGDPPRPLLAAGIAKDLDDLLRQRFGAGGYDVIQLNVTWSERLAQYLNAIAPLLMGLGVLCLFIEFKTPGFGFFGIAGIVLLAVVFLGHYIAGFSGHEPMILFALGLLLLAIEVFFFPGVAVLAVSGVALMLGSLVWAMADIWPDQPLTIATSGDVFLRPLLNLGAGLTLALVLGVLIARFLPKGWLWDRMVLQAAVSTAAQVAGKAPDLAGDTAGLIGRQGAVVTPLRPGGEVEIDGRRYQAQLELGTAAVGTPVVVTGRTDFGLKVERMSS